MLSVRDSAADVLSERRARSSSEDADHSWVTRGACRGDDPDSLFVSGSEQHTAKRLCIPCPVRTECLAEALDSRVEFGVWGGLTERERRALLRRRPDVISWRLLLTEARVEHEDAFAAS